MLSSSRYRTGSRRVVVVDDDERTAREPPDHVDRRGRRHVERFEDELDRREGSAAGERGERPQPALVVGEQQLVAPPDRRSQRSAAFRLAAGRVAQHVEAVVEAAGDLLDRQRLGSRRGELDRQRQTVERTTELVHASSAVADAWFRRRALARRVNNSTASDERKRCELEHGLAVDVERNLAGAQDPQPGRRVEEANGERAPPHR